MKMTFTHAPLEKPRVSVYRGASGCLYVKSRSNEWFLFDEQGGIARFNSVPSGTGFTPVEGPVTITITDED